MHFNESIPLRDTIISGIYKITHKSSGKVYIGKSKYIYTRWQQHVTWSAQDTAQYICRSIRKHGVDEFEFEILVEHPDDDGLTDLEVKLIAEYDCMSPKGYNLTEGGFGGSSVYKIPEIAEKHRLAVNTPKEKARKSSTSKQMWADNHEHMKRVVRESRQTPESRAKTAKQAKAQMDDPVFREKLLGKSELCAWCGTFVSKGAYGKDHGVYCSLYPFADMIRSYEGDSELIRLFNSANYD